MRSGIPRSVVAACVLMFLVFMIFRVDGSTLRQSAQPLLKIIPSSKDSPSLPSQSLLESQEKIPSVPSLAGPAALLSPEHGAQTYPRAIKLRNGTLMAAFASFEPEVAISLSTSSDSGASWTPYGTVISAPASEYLQLNNPFLFQTPSGRLLCAFRAHSMVPELMNAEEKPGGLNENYRYYRLKIHYSDDMGRSWSYLSTPVEEQGPRNGLWEPFIRMSNAGELQFYYSREVNGRDQDNLMRVSSDGGLSWSEPVYVSGGDRETRDGMMGIQELSPGSGHLMAVFESVEEKGDGTVFLARFEVWTAQSRDDGKTWGERRMIYQGRNGDEKRNSGAPGIALVGKTLVVSFMTDEVKMEGRWHRNAFVKIITSVDMGKNWGNQLIIAEMPAAWAGLLTLNDTSLLVVCDHDDRVQAQRVTLA